MEKSKTTVLENRIDGHQRVFMDLLGESAIHIGYVMLASDGIPAGGLFHWKLDIGAERVYSLDAAGCPRLLKFLCSPGRAAPVPLLFSTLYFGKCLTSSVRGGVLVCRNCSAQLTRWRPWPVPSTTRLLLRLEGQFLHSAQC